MRLSVLITRHHRLLSLAAIVDVFEITNRFLQGDGKPALFHIQLVGLERKGFSSLPDSLSGYPTYTIYDSDIPKGDLVFIPAFQAGDIRSAVAENKDVIPWLVSQRKRGSLVASVCTGAFLLAATGLLDDKKATTHVDAAARFSVAFPNVKMQPHAVLTEDGGVYTSGGATSSFHLMLFLIQKYCGRDMALRVAKMLAVDMDRENQLYFDRFTPVLSHNDTLVKDAQRVIDKGYREVRHVSDVLEKLPASRRNLVRRFKQATGYTPALYLQKVKIEAAKRKLENSDEPMLDVMMASGYSDMKTFRQRFKALTGLTPTGYRQKFGMKL